MTSTKLNGKEKRMFVPKTNVESIDAENDSLFKAAVYLQQCGNEPGLSMSEFYNTLLADNQELSKDEFGRLTNAAVAIETMMEHGFSALDIWEEQTIH